MRLPWHMHGIACGTASASGCQLAIPKPLTATTVHKAYAFWAKTPGLPGTDFYLDASRPYGQMLALADITTVTYVDRYWRNQAKDVTDAAAAALDTLQGGVTYDFTVSETYPLLGCVVCQTKQSLLSLRAVNLLQPLLWLS